MKKYKVTMFILMLLMGCIYLQSFVAYANIFKVCIDAGHQEKPDKRLEPIGPGDGFSKPRVSSGTRGVASKTWEYEITLDCAKQLKDLLNSEASVLMTRESNDVNISNRERAIIANNEDVDISIKLHCDSLKDTSKTGASILIPSKNSIYTSKIYDESNIFANQLLESLKNSGIKINGIFERADMTGFNYSKVPVVILEMGFMSNYNEDQMLNSKNYQQKLMTAVKDAVIKYKNITKN